MEVKSEKTRIGIIAALTLAAAVAFGATEPGLSPGPGLRYATDAYPGFDNVDEVVNPERKEPRFFGLADRPEKENAAEQLVWCDECVSNKAWRAARKGYDALVRRWPSAPEAPVAQERLADLYFTHYLEYENAFHEYRYLLDFYSSQCDYRKVAESAYEMAKRMREEGKRVLYFRFANTVDVRRAFEAVVLRAPGAAFAPEAMLAVAELREDEGKYDTAVTVYENLRNLHPGTPEEKTALYRESHARMVALREHGYNRARCLDTVAFLRLTLASNRAFEGREEVEGWLAEAQEHVEDEAFKAAKFYDSNTRTRRSAIAAYASLVREYPASRHVEEARRRLDELKGEGK